MSRYIATRAIRGANAIVREAEVMLERTIAEKGADTSVEFPNTAYYLPFILGITGEEISTVGQLQPILEQAKQLLHPVPPDSRWTPYLGETLDCGMATLMAEEIIMARTNLSKRCYYDFILFDDNTDTRFGGEDGEMETQKAYFMAGQSGWQNGGKIGLLDLDGKPYSIIVNRMSKSIILEEGDIDTFFLEPVKNLVF